MDFYVKECKQGDVEHLIREYVSNLSSPIDSFLEDHILNSIFYSISYNLVVVGYYAIHNKQCLTQFYIDLRYSNESQNTFKYVLRKHSIQSILVPTCDELFLSLVLDHDYKIEKQAYIFQDNKLDIPKEKLYIGGEFRAAVHNDAIKIKEVCQDFIDKLEERIENGEIFIFVKRNTLLGLGIVERSILLDKIASIGMFTNEQFRKQGIGRTLIYNLKHWCYDNNLKPICGCWYYNIQSKQTIESAGMVSRTRLLNIKVH
jgi:GNAT superfamily N-acetyltransferase